MLDADRYEYRKYEKIPTTNIFDGAGVHFTSSLLVFYLMKSFCADVLCCVFHMSLPSLMQTQEEYSAHGKFKVD